MLAVNQKWYLDGAVQAVLSNQQFEKGNNFSRRKIKLDSTNERQKGTMCKLAK